MKRSLLIIVLSIFIGSVQPIFSQTTSFGAKVGGNVSTWYSSGISNTQFRFGFQAGAVWDIDYGNNFHFSPEVLFIQKGAVQRTNNASGNIRDNWKMSYIEIPLMAKFDLADTKNNHPFFSLGATAAYFINGTYKKTQDGTEVSNGNIDNLDRKYDFGAAAGAGMNLGSWIFEFRGQIGFVSLINASLAKNATLSINFTYLFNNAGHSKDKDEYEEEYEEEY